MKLARIGHFFKNHYFLLAFSAGLISYTLPYYNEKKGLLCVFISLAVFLAYNTHKLVKWLREEGSYASIQSLRFLPTRIVFFVATLSFLGIGISLHFRWSEYFLLSLLFFMCVSYSVFQPKLSIRSIPYLKSFFIALSWTSLCCALPMSYANKAIYNGSFFFILFYVLAVSSDFRDLRIDPIELKTIPQVLPQKSLTYSYIFMLTCLCCFQPLFLWRPILYRIALLFLGFSILSVSIFCIEKGTLHGSNIGRIWTFSIYFASLFPLIGKEI
jgi:hypothetical protein